MAISGGRMRPESLEDAVLKRLATGGVDFMYGLLDATAGTALKTLFAPEGKAGRSLISDDVLKEKAAAAEYERKKNMLESDKTRAEIAKTKQTTLLTKAETEDYPSRVKREQEMLAIRENLALLQAQAAVTNAAANTQRAQTDEQYKESQKVLAQARLRQDKLEAKQADKARQRELDIKAKAQDAEKDKKTLKQSRDDYNASAKAEAAALKELQKNNTPGNVKVHQNAVLATQRTKINAYKATGKDPGGPGITGYERILQRAEQALQNGDTQNFLQMRDALLKLPVPVE